MVLVTENKANDSTDGGPSTAPESLPDRKLRYTVHYPPTTPDGKILPDPTRPLGSALNPHQPGKETPRKK